jgi:hypothetical protein
MMGIPCTLSDGGSGTLLFCFSKEKKEIGIQTIIGARANFKKRKR